MTLTPLVSIVLPTYNGERYLSEAIESIIAQTYKNWELIIVDDASTDQTAIIINEYLYKDERIKKIRHETNRKLPAALNTGFSQAKGEYLTWTSDDNCYQPDAIEEMVFFLKIHPEVDFVYTDFDLIDKNGKTINTNIVHPVEKLVDAPCLGGCFLYKRIIQEKIGPYDENMFLVEDYDFFLRVSNFYNIYPYHKNLYKFRSHPESLTATRLSDAEFMIYKARWKNVRKLNWVTKQKKAQAYVSMAVAGQKFNKKDIILKSILMASYFDFRVIMSSTVIGLLIFMVFGKHYFSQIQEFYQKFTHS